MRRLGGRWRWEVYMMFRKEVVIGGGLAGRARRAG